jgi:hypothetical protein
MSKRNPVVRDLIQRPPRGAGKHHDRRRQLRESDTEKETKNIFTKAPARGFFYVLSVYGLRPTNSELWSESWQQ